MNTATWSVIVSGIVAISVPAFAWINSNTQRNFDRAQAFEERAWAIKADGLFPVIGAARMLSDEISKIVGRPIHERAVKALVNLQREISDNLAVIETYGSSECRTAAIGVLRLVDQIEIDDLRLISAESRAQLKENAVDAVDFEEAATQRRLEVELYRSVAAGIEFDDVLLHQEVHHLMDTCRADLRSD